MSAAEIRAVESKRLVPVFKKLCALDTFMVQEVTQSLECSGAADDKHVAETLRAPTWMNCNANEQDPGYAADLRVMAV